MARNIIRYRKAVAEKKELARDLRKEMTPAEEKLWDLLRDGRMNGIKFRRQQIIAGFVVDFYCARLNLAIEIDGEVHAFQRKYDEERQKHLEAKGIHVLRYSNEQVLSRTETVLKDLAERMV